MNKFNHVRNARNDGQHTCHWPGCSTQVKPAFWGCGKHWRLIPYKLKQGIWNNYRAGQEIDKQPSQAYLKAAHEIELWIARFILRTENPAEIARMIDTIVSSKKQLSDWENGFMSRIQLTHAERAVTDHELIKLKEVFFKCTAAPAKRISNRNGTRAH